MLGESIVLPWLGRKVYLTNLYNDYRVLSALYLTNPTRQGCYPHLDRGGAKCRQVREFAQGHTELVSGSS